MAAIDGAMRIHPAVPRHSGSSTPELSSLRLPRGFKGSAGDPETFFSPPQPTSRRASLSNVMVGNHGLLRSSMTSLSRLVGAVSSSAMEVSTTAEVEP